jgi:hypothetical protein
MVVGWGGEKEAGEGCQEGGTTRDAGSSPKTNAYLWTARISDLANVPKRVISDLNRSVPSEPRGPI